MTAFLSFGAVPCVPSGYRAEQPVIVVAKRRETLRGTFSIESSDESGIMLFDDDADITASETSRVANGWDLLILGELEDN
eukprot:CCRYP_000434-RB/>CCRYP_000434-RB protein AED:0.49 eAED:0.78 QI:0/0/0/1/0/0/3/0/79